MRTYRISLYWNYRFFLFMIYVDYQFSIHTFAIYSVRLPRPSHFQIL